MKMQSTGETTNTNIGRLWLKIPGTPGPGPVG